MLPYTSTVAVWGELEIPIVAYFYPPKWVTTVHLEEFDAFVGVYDDATTALSAGVLWVERLFTQRGPLIDVYLRDKLDSASRSSWKRRASFP